MEPLIAPILSLLLLAGGLPLEGTGSYPVAPAAVEADQDADGVTDASDLCPDTEAGFPVDPDGCAADTDSDGVPDGLDRCPGTRVDSPGVDRNGCSVRDLKKERTYRFPVGLA